MVSLRYTILQNAGYYVVMHISSETVKINKYVTLFICTFLSFSAWAEDTIVFTCTWDNEQPIEIRIDSSSGTAIRNDGGKEYQVIKITKWAIWLEVYEPTNVAGLKIQMIERAEATDGKGGKWVDTVHSVTGEVSPIVGGTCWEK